MSASPNEWAVPMRCSPQSSQLSNDEIVLPPIQFESPRLLISSISTEGALQNGDTIPSFEEYLIDYQATDYYPVGPLPHCKSYHKLTMKAFSFTKFR